MATPEEARRPFGARSPRRGEPENPQPDANTPGQWPASQTRSEQHPGCCTRETGLPRRPFLALRMALIVSWGPLGTSPTQARRVLRHEAAGPWTLAGRRLGDHSHVTGIQVSPRLCRPPQGAMDVLWVPPKPDSGRGHCLETGSDGGEARLFTATVTASTVSEARLFCILQSSLLPLRDTTVISMSQMEKLRHRTVTGLARVTVWRQPRQIWAV